MTEQLSIAPSGGRLPHIGDRVIITGDKRRKLAAAVGEAFVSRSPRMTVVDVMMELGCSAAFAWLILEDSDADFFLRWEGLGIKRACDVDLENRRSYSRYRESVWRVWREDTSLTPEMLARGIGLSLDATRKLVDSGKTRRDLVFRRPRLTPQQRETSRLWLAEEIRRRYECPDLPSVQAVADEVGYSVITVRRLLRLVDTPMRVGRPKKTQHEVQREVQMTASATPGRG